MILDRIYVYNCQPSNLVERLLDVGLKCKEPVKVFAVTHGLHGFNVRDICVTKDRGTFRAVGLDQTVEKSRFSEG